MPPNKPPDIVAVLMASHRNSTSQMLTSEDIEWGWRSALRDVAVRLGVYPEFTEALEKEKTDANR